MTNILSINELIHRTTLGIAKEIKKKCRFYFYCFCFDILIRNESLTSKKRKAKKPLK